MTLALNINGGYLGIDEDSIPELITLIYEDRKRSGRSEPVAINGRPLDDFTTTTACGCKYLKSDVTRKVAGCFVHPMAREQQRKKTR